MSRKPLGQYLGLGPAQGRTEGGKLPVEVRGLHGVGIDQGQAAHTGAAQHLGRVGAHAAHAHHQDVRPAEAFHLFIAQQEARALHPVLFHDVSFLLS